MKNNSEVRQTNIGKAKFCYISEPDTQFDSKGIYHTSIEFNKADAEPEIKAILEVIQKKIAEIHKAKPGSALVKRAPLPYKEDNEKIVIKFKSKFKPKIFDGKQKELDPSISVYKESTMKVQYKLQPYDQNIGVGCALYLLSVQVVNLVQGTPVGECPFPPVNANGESVLPGPTKELC